MIYTIYHSRDSWGKPAALCLTLLLVATLGSLSDETTQLLLVGILMGFVFIHFGFGFTGNWHQFMTQGKSAGVRGHLWLLALGSLIFFPALNLLPELGYSANGAIRPLGANVFIGAFVFGVGMALLGTCSSGTLRLLGEFKFRYYWVFICMIIGGTVAASQFEFWLTFSQWGVYSFAMDINWQIGLIINLALLAVLYATFKAVERKKHGQVVALIDKQNNDYSFGVSPVLWAAILVAILCFGVLFFSGNTWAVSWIFPKLGVIAIDWLVLDIDWAFWEFAAINETGLEKPLVEDKIILTSFGFFLGVAIYHVISHLTNSPTKNRRTELGKFGIKSFIITSGAGLMMGYGAVIAYGCNIGGLLSAVISGSIHGWAWFASAFIGMALTLFITTRLSR